MSKFRCMADKPALKTVPLRFWMELEGKHVRAERKRLIAAHLHRSKPFRSCGKIECVAMPVQHRHAIQMSQSTRPPCLGESHRRPTDFFGRAGINASAERSRHQLCAKANAQCRLFVIEPLFKQCDLRPEERILVVLIGADRTAEHHQQVEVIRAMGLTYLRGRGRPVCLLRPLPISRRRCRDIGTGGTTPADELLSLPIAQGITDPLRAYQISKRGNVLRVKAEAVKWGKRGARVNAISPGIIVTPLAKDELSGPRGVGYRRMIDLSPAGRAGTPDEVGTLGALLMGPDGAFITGNDFLADGGVTASFFYGELVPQ